MSAPVEPQTVDSKEFIPVCDYNFLGNTDTVEKKRRFIEFLRNESTVYHAALYTGISRKTAYRWQEVDPAFAEAWADALQDATDVMEHSVYHQALNGDSLLKMFWLKKHRPEYRDKMTIDVQVIEDEIRQRMQQLNLRQLPAVTTEFIDAVLVQNRDKDDELQKEPAASPAATTTTPSSE
jgi:hypothetical protein